MKVSETIFSDIKEDLKYYVYRLIDPRNEETFYIGMGQAGRLFDHVNEKDETNAKNKIIQEIKEADYEPQYIIHRHGMDTKEEAQHVEAALIDYIGIYNIANIQGGIHSDKLGPASPQKLITRYMEAPEEILIDRDVKLLALNINNTYEEQETYEAVRFAWHVNKEKAEQAQYVLAMYRERCVGVFRPIEWLPATEDNFPNRPEYPEGRYGFVGQVADKEIMDKYKGKCLPEGFKMERNPVRYLPE